MTDPEKTEDVEEGMDLRGLTAGGIFAKCRQYLDNLRVEMGADDPREAEVIGATRTLTEILDRFTSLREQLEEVEAERDRWEDEAEHNLSIIRDLRDQRDAARRRADRLEKAADFALSTIKSLDPHGKKDGQTPQAKELLIRALDSREDEGEESVHRRRVANLVTQLKDEIVIGGGFTETAAKVYDEINRELGTLAEPIHADEPERDDND